MAADDDVLDKAKAWLEEGHAVALATVVETWGSSPRPPGSQLAVRADGLFAGSVSGGCVEGRVVESAQLALRDHTERVLEFGVSDDEAWGVGLACGGTIRIRVEPIASSQVDALLAARIPLALVIIGAVHTADPLVRIASMLGYDVTLIDPRDAFAHPERWPGTKVFTDYPDEVMSTMKIGARTAIVALTHDPKIDDPAIETALRTDAFYIGALGSKKTHAARLDRLRGRGFSDPTLARIHGPIGLPIGARSPAEIAVAIAAQMTESLRVVRP